jgi:cyclopropane-fatty-acyl-phospholipid synthase
MLYKFKSKNAADVIMLEPNGRQVLQAIGKQTGPSGIIQSAEMPAAITALEAAIAQDESARRAAGAEAKSPRDDDEAPSQVISFRQRAAPFIELLKRSAKDGTDIVWGA